MSTLIIGGTGTVGSEVVRRLLEKDEEVRILTRSEEKARELPEGAEGVVGDLTDPSTLDGVFEGAEKVFLLNAVSPSELQEGLIAVEEARRAGTDHIVYLSVHKVDADPRIPHFASKVAVEDAIQSTGIAYTFLRPNNFYQNDVWFKDAILEHGIYPQPLGAAGDPGSSRVDVRDVAKAAANALTGSGHRNRIYALVGPEPLTGEDCARIYSEALGREVRYGGSDLDAWEEQARQGLPAWLAYDFRIMYEMFLSEGFDASPEDREETRAILGGEPRPFEAFVRETASAWREAVGA